MVGPKPRTGWYQTRSPDLTHQTTFLVVHVAQQDFVAELQKPYQSCIHRMSCATGTDYRRLSARPAEAASCLGTETAQENSLQQDQRTASAITTCHLISSMLPDPPQNLRGDHAKTAQTPQQIRSQKWHYPLLVVEKHPPFIPCT